MGRKILISKIIYDIFQVSVFTFVVFFILENLKKGLITNYLDFNLILIICLISGILSVLLGSFDKKSKINKNILALSLGFLSAIIVYFVISDLSRGLAFVVSIITFVSIIIITRCQYTNSY